VAGGTAKASGLMWKNVGSTVPPNSSRLYCTSLAKALEHSTSFSESEWAAFEVGDVHLHHHIQSEGGSYYQPAHAMPMDAVECYDPLFDVWVTLPPLLTARCWASGSVVQEQRSIRSPSDL